MPSRRETNRTSRYALRYICWCRLVSLLLSFTSLLKRFPFFSRVSLRHGKVERFLLVVLFVVSFVLWGWMDREIRGECFDLVSWNFLALLGHYVRGIDRKVSTSSALGGMSVGGHHYHYGCLEMFLLFRSLHSWGSIYRQSPGWSSQVVYFVPKYTA
jgi:hypothetical protein